MSESQDNVAISKNSINVVLHAISGFVGLLAFIWTSSITDISLTNLILSLLLYLIVFRLLSIIVKMRTSTQKASLGSATLYGLKIVIIFLLGISQLAIWLMGGLAFQLNDPQNSSSYLLFLTLLITNAILLIATVESIHSKLSFNTHNPIKLIKNPLVKVVMAILATLSVIVFFVVVLILVMSGITT